MLTNTRTVRIQWGDCDPAGIVYFPRFFAMFDDATAALFERALGMTKYQLMAKTGMAGWPLVDTRARFILPSRFGDDVVIESTVTAFRRSSFDVQHRMLKDGALAIEAFDTRVWTARDPDDPSRIKSHPVPAEVIARFQAG
jgi:4-hydroxybenzoyl-CoA thioesterase